MNFHVDIVVDGISGLGRVVFSRHALERCERDRLSERAVMAALRAQSVPDGQTIVHREAAGVRLVIETKPTPERGAALVLTAYRVRGAARAKRTS